MSVLLRRNAPLIKILSRAKPSALKAIVKDSDKSLIDTLCECSLNVLQGRVKLTPSQKSKLKRHKKTLRALATHRKLSLSKKKSMIQKGGFLQFLLKPVVTALGSLLGGM